MASSSSSIPGPISAAPQQTSKLLSVLAEFLIRRRILLSAILFVLLIGDDVVFGPKPHDLINYRDPLSMLGAALVLSGLALRSWAVGIFRKDAELTTTGPYRLIRNPLYVGSFMMMFGFCALIADPTNIWFILGPMLVMYIIKVRQEERLLSTRFPEQWTRVLAKHAPVLSAVRVASAWRPIGAASQWMRSREYQAVGATILALVAIKVWQLI